MGAARSMLTTETAVPAEQRASYAAIIDEILATADLETISAKRIRIGLQERVDYDLGSQKVLLIDETLETTTDTRQGCYQRAHHGAL